MATCQHAKDRSPEEQAAIDKMGPGERANLPVEFCPRGATVWRLPDSREGYYCADHGPKVLARVQRRIAMRGDRS
jgi:hypothetical protein